MKKDTDECLERERERERESKNRAKSGGFRGKKRKFGTSRVVFIA
jgi:hypothetical protein